MPAALPLSSYISQTSQGDTEFRTLSVQYGNGYSQRAGDGINNAKDSWNIDYGSLSASEFATVVAAFHAARGVDYFTWTAPGDAVQKKWIVKKFSRSALAGDIYNVTATLEQVFDQ